MEALDTGTVLSPSFSFSGTLPDLLPDLKSINMILIFTFNAFQRTVYDVLPPVLGNPDYITDKEHFQTTTGTTHDYKAHGGTLSNTQFKKAPGSWKVHYVEDNIARVSHCCNSVKHLT